MPTQSESKSLAEYDAKSRQVVVVDTETTGFGQTNRPPRLDGIVQVGFAWRNMEGRVIRWQESCNPGESFFVAGRADEAPRVSGLTLPMVRAARSASEVATDFREKLGGIEKESRSPVELRSFNRAFDEPFLAAPPWNIPRASWGPCVMLAAQEYLCLERWPGLALAVNLTGIQPPEGRAHTAAVDAHTALLVLEKCLAGPRRSSSLT
jgi:DNA polymerase III epsilon subunit-like protein